MAPETSRQLPLQVGESWDAVFRRNIVALALAMVQDLANEPRCLIQNSSRNIRQIEGVRFRVVNEDKPV